MHELNRGRAAELETLEESFDALELEDAEAQGSLRVLQQEQRYIQKILMTSLSGYASDSQAEYAAKIQALRDLLKV